MNNVYVQKLNRQLDDLLEKVNNGDKSELTEAKVARLMDDVFHFVQFTKTMPKGITKQKLTLLRGGKQ